MNQRTPLYEQHQRLGAKLCAFAGYDMPIDYSEGTLKEHEWVREHAGLFDVSHMGQAMVTGAGAAEFFSKITPSNFTAWAAPKAKYTVLTNDAGGIIDDLIITRIAEDKFFVVFNAGRKEVDIAHMRKNLPQGVTFELLENALIALQGPQAEAVLARELPTADVANIPYMTLKQADWRGTKVIVSRLGYTGEDGFEISVPAAQAGTFWEKLLSHSEVKPIGLGARDSLRLEMGYPLYGHDLNEQTTPIEAALGWVVSKDHAGYFGVEKITRQKTSGTATRRVGIRLTGAGIAREGSAIYVGNEKIGTLSSGGFSPTLKAAIGQGYIESRYANDGQQVEVEVRGRRIPAVVAPLSFVPARTKPSTKKAA